MHAGDDARTLGVCGHVVCDICVCSLSVQGASRKCPICRDPVYWCTQWNDSSAVYFFEVKLEAVGDLVTKLCTAKTDSHTAVHAWVAGVCKMAPMGCFVPSCEKLVKHLVSIVPSAPQTAVQWVSVTHKYMEVFGLPCASEWMQALMGLLYQAGTPAATVRVLKAIGEGFERMGEALVLTLDIAHVVNVLSEVPSALVARQVMVFLDSLDDLVRWRFLKTEEAVDCLMRFETLFKAGNRAMYLQLLQKVVPCAWTDDGVARVLPVLEDFLVADEGTCSKVLSVLSEVSQSGADKSPVRRWLTDAVPACLQRIEPGMLPNTLLVFAAACTDLDFVVASVRWLSGVLRSTHKTHREFLNCVQVCTSFVRHEVWDRADQGVLKAEVLALGCTVMALWRRLPNPQVDITCLRFFRAVVARNIVGLEFPGLVPLAVASVGRFEDRNTLSVVMAVVCGMASGAQFRVDLLGKWSTLLKGFTDMNGGECALSVVPKMTKALRVLFKSEGDNAKWVRKCAKTLRVVCDVSATPESRWTTAQGKHRFELILDTALAGLDTGVADALPHLIQVCVQLAVAASDSTNPNHSVFVGALGRLTTALWRQGPAVGADFAAKLGTKPLWQLLMSNHDDALLLWALEKLADEVFASPCVDFRTKVCQWIFSEAGRHMWMFLHRALGGEAPRPRSEVLVAVKCVHECLKWDARHERVRVACRDLQETARSWHQDAEVLGLAFFAMDHAVQSKVKSVSVSVPLVLQALKAHIKDDTCVARCVALLGHWMEVHPHPMETVEEVHRAVWGVMTAQKMPPGASACAQLLRSIASVKDAQSKAGEECEVHEASSSKRHRA